LLLPGGVLSRDIHASAVQDKEQPNCDEDVNGNALLPSVDVLSPASAVQDKGKNNAS